MKKLLLFLLVVLAFGCSTKPSAKSESKAEFVTLNEGETATIHNGKITKDQ